MVVCFADVFPRRKCRAHLTNPQRNAPLAYWLEMQFPLNPKPFLLVTSIAALCGAAFAVDAPAAKPAAAATNTDAPAKPSIEPTFANVAYGTHERQVLDFYQAKKGARPNPLLFFIHGGGWVGGDKGGRTGASVKQYLDAGISVVSINYRYSWQDRKSVV